jgi:hypothetical protein
MARRGDGILVCALALAGCVSMSPAAQGVRVVRNANHVRDCTSLGEIEATSGWGGAFAGAGGLANNKATLRNETAQRGGDTLLILTEQATFAPHTIGEAYRCAR